MRFPRSTLPFTALLVTAVAFAPAAAAGQTVGDLLASVQRGGGWISVPIRSGSGHLTTGTLPTVGLTVAGCVHVWGGHTGTWDIEAHDTHGSGHLKMSADAGESVPFTYAAGMRSQLEVDFSWSEPRDTTLYLWVGLARPNQDPASTCQPVDG